jgi:hypothetical protein
VARAQARVSNRSGQDGRGSLVVVLGHSAAVTLDEERTAASQHSGVPPSVVENIYYIDVV